MSYPQYCPSPRELDDLELLTTGALTPIAAFNEPGSPVTLDALQPLPQRAPTASMCLDLNTLARGPALRPGSQPILLNLVEIDTELVSE